MAFKKLTIHRHGLEGNILSCKIKKDQFIQPTTYFVLTQTMSIPAIIHLVTSQCHITIIHALQAARTFSGSSFTLDCERFIHFRMLTILVEIYVQERFMTRAVSDHIHCLLRSLGLTLLLASLRENCHSSIR